MGWRPEPGSGPEAAPGKVPAAARPASGSPGAGLSSGAEPGDSDLVQAFDPRFYRASNPSLDISEGGALAHYLAQGWRERRDPAPWFSTAAYLAAYEDVRRSGLNPFVHYLRYGRWEGRSAGVRGAPADLAPPRAAVRPEAPDAQASGRGDPGMGKPDKSGPGPGMSSAGPSGSGPSESRTLESGAGESAMTRPGTTTARTPDAAASARIADVIAPHFDRAYYLSLNPDVAAEGSDPVLHYVTAGWAEGRDPTPDFSTAYYLDSNPDVRAEGLNPFWHYIVAGRDENRLPREPGGWKAQILKGLVPLERTVATWRRNAPDTRPADLDALAGAIGAALRRGSGHLILAFTHDDYHANVGGVQLCVLREEEAAREAGHCYLSLRPSQPLPRLAAPGEGAEVEVRLGGEALGSAEVGAVVAAAARACARGGRNGERVGARVGGKAGTRGGLAAGLAAGSATGSRPGPKAGGPAGSTTGETGAGDGTPGVSLVVHSLMGHAPEAVAAAAGALAPVRAWFWLHDNFSICPSYALLRNGITFCGAPPADSPACAICLYGAERASHRQRMRALFEGVPFAVVSPSESELELWTARSGLATATTRVLPHLTLDAAAIAAEGPERPRAAVAGETSATPRDAAAGETSATPCDAVAGDDHPTPRDAAAVEDLPVRLAFCGIASTVKGWPVFRRLAERGGAGLEFHYFGVDDPGTPAIAAHAVAVTPRHRMAMRDALAAAGADLAVIWSECPETFCFVAHEALAAGTAILTHTGTGNVAALVRATGRGRVLGDEADLTAFVTGGGARELAISNRANGPQGAGFTLSRMTVDLIEGTGDAARGSGGAAAHGPLAQRAGAPGASASGTAGRRGPGNGPADSGAPPAEAPEDGASGSRAPKGGAALNGAAMNAAAMTGRP